MLGHVGYMRGATVFVATLLATSVWADSPDISARRLLLDRRTGGPESTLCCPSRSAPNGRTTPESGCRRYGRNAPGPTVPGTSYGRVHLTESRLRANVRAKRVRRTALAAWNGAS